MFPLTSSWGGFLTSKDVYCSGVICMTWHDTILFHYLFLTALSQYQITETYIKSQSRILSPKLMQSRGFCNFFFIASKTLSPSALPLWTFISHRKTKYSAGDGNLMCCKSAAPRPLAFLLSPSLDRLYCDVLFRFLTTLPSLRMSLAKGLQHLCNNNLFLMLA